jgi:hypothetical protein
MGGRYTRPVNRMRATWAALFVLALLFAQGALAAYACPATLSGGAAGEVPCEQMDGDSLPLCHGHCADEEQKPHEGAATAVAQFVPSFVVRIPLEPDPGSDGWAAAARDSPAAAPPLILRNRRLRI